MAFFPLETTTTTTKKRRLVEGERERERERAEKKARLETEASTPSSIGEPHSEPAPNDRSDLHKVSHKKVSTFPVSDLDLRGSSSQELQDTRAYV